MGRASTALEQAKALIALDGEHALREAVGLVGRKQAASILKEHLWEQWQHSPLMPTRSALRKHVAYLLRKRGL